MDKVFQLKLECTRCKHKWVTRNQTPPKTCPKCKSPYWAKKRGKDNNE